MRRLLGLAIALVLAGCAIGQPRQTLLRLPGDEASVYVEGRGQLCAGIEEGGTGRAEVCELTADVEALQELALFGRSDHVVLVAVVPLDVAEVEIVADGTSVQLTPTPSDLATALLVAQVPRGPQRITLVLRDADGTQLQRVTVEELPDPGAVTRVGQLAP